MSDFTLLSIRRPRTHACTAMDTDKIKVFGARIKVDSTGKLAELERAEKVRELAPEVWLDSSHPSIGEDEG